MAAQTPRNGDRMSIGSTCIIDEFGNKEWRNSDGDLHRTDGPAIEWANGTESWYWHGNLHREGGPAYTGRTGDKYWYRFHNLHRLDGPAIECVNGDKAWFIYGERYEPLAWLLKLHEMGIE